MNQAYADFISGISVFLLVLIRTTGLFVIAPIFGRRNMPAYFKMGFAFFVALVIFNTLARPSINMIDNIWLYTGTIFKELMVGIVIGYVGFVIFTAIYLAGQFIDMQMGLGIVSVIDPNSNMQIPITSNLYYTITMIIFLITGGHHLLIRALFESFNLVPINQAVFSTLLMTDILRIFGGIFIIGFKISAPIVSAVFVADITLGIMTKTVPQLNIFVVGLPLKILFGLIVMLVTIPAFSMIVNTLISGMDAEMYETLKHMGAKP